MKILISSLILLSLLSCSTIKEEDCENRNWYQQGFLDGSSGLDRSMYDTYLKVCEQKETPESKETFMKGHALGSTKYCTKRNGYLVGESGRPLPKQCDSLEFPDFKEGYEKGRLTTEEDALSKELKK